MVGKWDSKPDECGKLCNKNILFGNIGQKLK
jgi:hypothetical protein